MIGKLEMIDFSFISEAGGREFNNERTAVFGKKNNRLFVLCSSICEGDKESTAAQVALEAVEAVFEEGELQGKKLLTECILKANSALINMQQSEENRDDFKATIALLHVKNGVARYAHAGDTRIYVLQKHSIKAKTLDHSAAQILALMGDINETELATHEERRRLLRFLGNDELPPKMALSAKIGIMPGTSFLMCSDGFWEMITEKEISKYYKSSKTVEHWLEKMKVAINKRCKEDKEADNFSAIGVWGF